MPETVTLATNSDSKTIERITSDFIPSLHHDDFFFELQFSIAPPNKSGKKNGSTAKKNPLSTLINH